MDGNQADLLSSAYENGGDPANGGTSGNPGDQGTNANQDNNPGGASGDNNQTAPPAWMAQLPVDLKDQKSLTKFKTIGDLGKSYMELERKSSNSIQMPGENATDDELSRYYGQLGRPETADRYTLQAPNLPEGMSFDKTLETDFKTQAFTSGLNESQAKKIYDWLMGKQTESYASLVTARKEALSQAENNLKADWGEKYSENMALMGRGLKTFADDQFISFVKKSGLGNNADFAKIFAKIGKAISDDALITGADNGTDDNDGMFSYPSLKQ